MIKNILYTIGIFSALFLYYLFYEYQNNQFINLNIKLDLINKKLDSLILKSGSSLDAEPINYKENNIIKNEIVNFSDSLIKLFDNDVRIKKITDIHNASNNNIKVNIDTFCYDLSEQYKIINFYNNKIRIKNLLLPGSILMSINDSLIHNDVTYILKEINGEGSYIKLHNPKNDNFCKFHKIKSL
tara:strand:+ start:7337 stop:7891 length:555 start_codon:yes stop_codon:yes gene_type:complete